MLPAVKPGIDGPLAGPDQRQRHGPAPPIPRQFQTWAGDEKATHASAHPATTPATGVHKPAMSRRPASAPITCGAATVPPGVDDRAVQQSGADQQSLNQQPGARRTVRERGEQPLHMYPVFSLRKWQRF